MIKQIVHIHVMRNVKKSTLGNNKFTDLYMISVELRNVSIVMVHTSRDNIMGTLLAVVVGLVLSTSVFVIGK